MMVEDSMGRPFSIVPREGLVFGYYTLVRFDSRTWQGAVKWLCRCICGREKVVLFSSLRNGNTKSCGCMKHENASGPVVHGMTNTVEHRTWSDMIQRCTNQNKDGYKNYGGRGIKVCERWMTFTNFYKDMGKRPKGMSLDRIDVNGDYEPSNCKWSTWSEQMSNRRKHIVDII